MDHFPIPDGAEHIAVPYICDLSTYDGDGDFFTYPGRHGWPEDKLCGKPEFDFSSTSPESYQSFYQFWLYFGFLNEVLSLVGVSFNPMKFIQQTAHGKAIITTETLPDIITQWHSQAPAAKKGSKQKRYKKIEPVFEAARNFINIVLVRFNGALETHGIVLPDWPKIEMSIVALAWTLRYTAYRLYVSPTEWHKPPFGEHRLLRERLQAAGWCKGEIGYLFLKLNLNIDALYYIGFLECPRRDHDHANCTDMACRSKGINEAVYVTRHAADCISRDCGDAEIEDGCAGIVKEGGIPLVSWSSEGGIKVTKYDINADTDVPYVAISHIWSDGMGNLKKNALPKCQLRWLQGRVDDLYSEPRKVQNRHQYMFGPTVVKKKKTGDVSKPAGFWMDTLCIPVADHLVEYRKKAIGQMRDIYENADRVLVFDSWVRETPVSASLAEKAARLYLSNWQHRLWTMQEGILAANLFIQFRDGVESLEDLIDRNLEYRKSYPGMYTGLVEQTLSRIPVASLALDTTDFPKDMSSAGNKLYGVLIGFLRSRNTTRKADEAVCLATLLGIDPEPLLKIPKPEGSKAKTDEERAYIDQYMADRRMEELLRIVFSFEQWIIFNPLPRLLTDGFRWAPRTLLGQARDIIAASLPTPQEPVLETPLLPDDGGLLVIYPGIVLASLESKHLPEFYVIRRRHRQVWYRVSLEADEDGKYIELDPTASLEYALVTSIPVVRSNAKPILSIFGELKERDDDAPYQLRHLCRATVTAVDQSKLSRDEAVGLGKTQADAELEPVLGDWISERQSWIIL